MGKPSRRVRSEPKMPPQEPERDLVVESWLPPIVENRIPSPEEMEEKAASGRYYVENVWIICRQFPTHGLYEVPMDLPNLVNSMYSEIRDLGYEFVDVSTRLDGITGALELTLAWAHIVREARTQKKMLLMRRTPSNCGAALMLQRLEHLRQQCTEFAPLAYIILVRDDQMVVTRDRVMDQANTERVLIALAKNKQECAGDDESERAKLTQRPPTMTDEMFEQQVRGVETLMQRMSTEDDSIENGTGGTDADAQDDPKVLDVTEEGAGDKPGVAPSVSDAAEKT